MHRRGALHWTGCWANSVIVCFNNAYLEGKKNRVRLKLWLIKKKVAVTHISQNCKIFDRICGVCNVHVFVYVQTWLWRFFLLFVCFCSFCFLHHHRVALPGVGILWNCLRLTGKHCSLAVSTRTVPSCFSFLFLTIKGCLEFMGIILYKGNNEINDELFSK